MAYLYHIQEWVYEIYADRLSGPNNINARLNIMSESVEDKISDMEDEIEI